MNTFNKIVAVAMVAVALSACGNDRRICNETYDTVGVLTFTEMHPQVKYRMIVGNVVWSVVLAPVILLPTIYFLGFSLYEPVKETVSCDQFNHKLGFPE